MRHTTPTSLAQTQRSEGACPQAPSFNSLQQGKLEPGKAGTTPQTKRFDAGFLFRANLCSLQLDHLSKELPEFTHTERLQLSETARFSMDEEIRMLRKMLRRFVQAAEMAEEEDYPDHLAKSLDLLGLTCSRLASVLRVNMNLSNSADEDKRREVDQAMRQVWQELQSFREDSHA